MFLRDQGEGVVTFLVENFLSLSADLSHIPSCLVLSSAATLQLLAIHMRGESSELNPITNQSITLT